MDRLAAVVEGSDVRQVIGGHYHYSTYSTFAGVPVSVASASCYTTDVAPKDRLISGVDGHQAFTMMHVYDDRIVNTVVPLAEAPEVSGFGLDMLPVIDALSPEERLDQISRKDSDFNLGVEGPTPRRPLGARPSALALGAANRVLSTAPALRHGGGLADGVEEDRGPARVVHEDRGVPARGLEDLGAGDGRCQRALARGRDRLVARGHDDGRGDVDLADPAGGVEPTELAHHLGDREQAGVAELADTPADGVALVGVGQLGQAEGVPGHPGLDAARPARPWLVPIAGKNSFSPRWPRQVVLVEARTSPATHSG